MMSLYVNLERWKPFFLSILRVVAARSSVPPFFKYAVTPVARNVWLPIFVVMPAALARRRIIA